LAASTVCRSDGAGVSPSGRSMACRSASVVAAANFSKLARCASGAVSTCTESAVNCGCASSSSGAACASRADVASRDHNLVSASGLIAMKRAGSATSKVPVVMNGKRRPDASWLGTTYPAKPTGWRGPRNTKCNGVAASNVIFQRTSWLIESMARDTHASSCCINAGCCAPRTKSPRDGSLPK